jgi:Rieske Fe-S protein
MDYCIRCNPVSELQKDADGELFCQFHGSQFILETRSDPVAEVVEPVVEPVAAE